MEAAHITWRPLGRLLVEQGLLSGDDLERALAEQQVTGQRLGETIVQLGFVSGPELANALAAQYGIELTTETGFGTGLRSQIQRRHESGRDRVVQLVPDPAAEATHLHVVEQAAAEPEPEPAAAAETPLLAQLEEQWAKLAAAEESLAEHERELTALAESRGRELAELAEGRDRALAELNERHQQDLRQLEEVNERLRAQIEELRRLPDDVPEPPPALPDSHLVFVQLAERYELISRDGPPPAPSTPLSLPDVEEGLFVVAGNRSSPLPGDERPCVFVQRG